MEALQMYWHIHHNVLAEFAIGPIEERSAFIRAKKPTEEIETRLRLMRPVQHEPFGPAVKAILTFLENMAIIRKAKPNKEGREISRKAWRIADQASRDYAKHRSAFHKELEALHKLECPDCPWDGETIFPGTT